MIYHLCSVHYAVLFINLDIYTLQCKPHGYSVILLDIQFDPEENDMSQRNFSLIVGDLTRIIRLFCYICPLTN